MTLKVGTLGGGFRNKPEIINTVYDFSVDGGTIKSYVMTAAASEDLLVKLVGMRVDTAITSTGAATLTVGNSDTAAAYVTTQGKATFTLNSFITPEACTTGTEGFVKLASGSTLTCAPATEVFSAGKVTFVWEVLKF